MKTRSFLSFQMPYTCTTFGCLSFMIVAASFSNVSNEFLASFSATGITPYLPLNTLAIPPRASGAPFWMVSTSRRCSGNCSNLASTSSTLVVSDDLALLVVVCEDPDFLVVVRDDMVSMEAVHGEVAELLVVCDDMVSLLMSRGEATVLLVVCDDMVSMLVFRDEAPVLLAVCEDLTPDESTLIALDGRSVCFCACT